MRRLALAAALIAAVASCGGDSSSPQPTSPGTPSQPGNPGTPSSPGTPATPTGPLTISILTLTTQTVPANQTPPEAMAVKVVDDKGAAVPNLPLTFVATSGGSVKGQTTTDTSGRAIVLWTLGPSAAPQTLTVSHPQIAKPAVFTGYVPIGSVTANPSTNRAYVGDTLSSYMTIKDTQGTVLTGSARVVVRDTLVARDVGTGTLIGRGDGQSYVVVVTGPLNTPKDSVKIDVYRELHGSVWTYDDSPLPAARAFSSNNGIVDSADVGANGRFSLKLTTHLTGWATEVGIDFANRANPTFFPALMPIARDCSAKAGVNCVGSDINADQSFILLPRRYTVRTGKYAGQTLALDLNAAMATSTHTGPSYLMASGVQKAALTFTPPAPATQNLYSVSEGAWVPDSFPIGVAVHRACCSTRAVVADDSVQLWRALDAIQSTLGLKIWTAVADKPEYSFPTDGKSKPTNHLLVFQFDSTLRALAGGATYSLGASLSSTDFVMSGWRNSAVEHLTVSNIVSAAQAIAYDPRAAGSLDHAVLVHEAMHTLGVGHGCQWTSTQSYCGKAPADTLPSFEDAAYLLMAMDVKAAAVKHRAPYAISAALFGERAFRLSLDPIPSPWTIPDPSSTSGPDALAPRTRPRS